MHSEGKVISMVRSITQLNTSDVSGGAEKVALKLFQEYRRRGLVSKLAVGYRKTDDRDVIWLERKKGVWETSVLGLASRLESTKKHSRYNGYALSLLHRISNPIGQMRRIAGLEDFHYPDTSRLFERIGRPDILHVHNLHGGYFDLRLLSSISKQVPLVMTLHDAWLTTGHCALSLDCERWVRGCGHCPDLELYPSIRRDATAFNWRLKRDIYNRSRLHVATPSHWLMDIIERSILMPAIRSRRIIPNSVETDIFRPGERIEARRQLGLPEEPFILLFAANSARNNPWKDFRCLSQAVAQLPSLIGNRKTMCVVLGATGSDEMHGAATMRFVPFQHDSEIVSAYFRAANVYLHSSKVETFSLTVAEALSSGVPVVASAVGAIPELVRALDHSSKPAFIKPAPLDQATGFLVASGDSAAMASASAAIANDEGLALALGTNACRDARSRFSQAAQADAYLAWYEEILAEHMAR